MFCLMIKLFELQEYNTKIILASEGLAPDPGPMKEYNDMMSALAQKYDNISFVNIAEKLHQYPSSLVYLDDCHLTEYGHKLVAQWFIQEIQKIPNKNSPASKDNKNMIREE